MFFSIKAPKERIRSARLPCKRPLASTSWALSLGLSISHLGCADNRKDAHCTPDATSLSDDDECIYAGPGKGPVVDEPACEVPPEEPAECPTFEAVKDIFSDPVGGNCTTSLCHGSEREAEDGLFLDGQSDSALYTKLTEFEGSVGTPYVVSDDPDTEENEALASWMFCNVAGLRGGGFPMPPPSGLAEADVLTLEAWLQCGAPGPDATGAGQ